MSPHPTPQELLAAFLEAHPTPSPAEVEALCPEHPNHASELRRLLEQAPSGQTATLYHPGAGPTPSGPRHRVCASAGRTLLDGIAEYRSQGTEF